jgi:hypothetical protein
MSTERDHNGELQAILDALAESVVEETDAQLLTELQESGGDPRALLAHVKSVLHQAVKAVRQRPLREARQAYEAHRNELEHTSYSLPGSVDERRTLLMNVIAANPSVGGMLTAQFREFDSLEDGDITSCLRQLAELGLLDAPKPTTDTR